MNLFAISPVDVMHDNRTIFTKDFVKWMPDNMHVYYAFEKEAFAVVANGFTHYSARTIIHYLRHYTAIRSANQSGWKLSNNVSPYLARLFALMHPDKASLFSYHRTKALRTFEYDDEY